MQQQQSLTHDQIRSSLESAVISLNDIALAILREDHGDLTGRDTATVHAVTHHLVWSGQLVNLSRALQDPANDLTTLFTNLQVEYSQIYGVNVDLWAYEQLLAVFIALRCLVEASRDETLSPDMDPDEPMGALLSE